MCVCEYVQNGDKVRENREMAMRGERETQTVASMWTRTDFIFKRKQHYLLGFLERFPAKPNNVANLSGLINSYFRDLSHKPEILPYPSNFIP